MFAEFEKFGVCATDVAELSSAEFREVSLSDHLLVCRAIAYTEPRM